MRKFMNVTLYRPAKKLVGPAGIGLGGVLLGATASLADATALFTAVDLTGFDTNLTAVLVTLIGISLMGAAYVYIKKALPGSF